MEKLKAKIGKHEHSLTDLLKILIFSIVMLAPIFAIATKCMYVSFNKNAYESYSGTSTQYVQKTLQTNEVNSIDDLIEGNVYIVYNHDNNNENLVLDDFFSDISFYGIVLFNATIETYYTDDIFSISSYAKYSNFTTDISYNVATYEFEVFYFTEDDTFYVDIYLTDTPSNFDMFFIFKYVSEAWETSINEDMLFTKGYLQACPQEYLQYTTYYEEVEVSTLDNVFYYAVDEIGNQPLFNWTKNTAMYTGINNMTTGLDMGNNNVIAVLLTYWVLMTLIYIIFDIIIFVITKITHALQ